MLNEAAARSRSAADVGGESIGGIIAAYDNTTTSKIHPGSRHSWPGRTHSAILQPVRDLLQSLTKRRGKRNGLFSNPRRRAGSITIKPGPFQIGTREDRARRPCRSPAALQVYAESGFQIENPRTSHWPTMLHWR